MFSASGTFWNCPRCTLALSSVFLIASRVHVSVFRAQLKARVSSRLRGRSELFPGPVTLLVPACWLMSLGRVCF